MYYFSTYVVTRLFSTIITFSYLHCVKFYFSSRDIIYYFIQTLK